MSDPYGRRLYRTHYEDALKLFNDGDIQGSIAAAKYNLTDTTLPPYYLIKNCILIAGALDTWDDAEIWRLAAEQAYTTNYYIALKEKDEYSLDALKDLREDLDELEEYKQDDIREYLGMNDYDVGDFDMDGDDSEYEGMEEWEDEAGSIDGDKDDDVVHDQTPLARPEDQNLADEEPDTTPAKPATSNADQLAGTENLRLSLPIRCAGKEPDTPVKSITSDMVPPAESPTTPAIRRQKSVKFNKGGAFHAHQFSRSVGRGSSLRPSLLSLSWKPKDEQDK